MKRATKNVRTWLGWIAFGLILSCSAAELIPKLANRTLEIHPEKPALYYDYCVKYKFLSSECKEWKTDFYDFTDAAKRKELRDMGFYCQSRLRGR